MNIQFQRFQLRVTDADGNVLLVIRKLDGSVEVYLNGHSQGEIEEPS